MTQIVVPDEELLDRVVRKFMNSTAGSNPNTLVLVALTEGEPSGWCWGYHLVRPDDTSMLYLHQLEVAEPHRRQGIGRALLRAFMTTGAQAGADQDVPHHWGRQPRPRPLRI